MKLPADHPAKKHVQSAQELLKLISKDPSLLDYDDLEFIRAYLQSLGVKLPEKKKDDFDDDIEEIGADNNDEDAVQSEEAAGEESEGMDESDDEDEEEPDPELVEEDSEPFPEMPDPNREPSDDDFEKATSYKAAAAEALENGNLNEAIEKYTQAILIAPSGLTFAKRAECLLKLKPPRPVAAIRDCSRALEQNPDSAKALKMRGTAYRMLGKWEEAAKDLRQACIIDFDDHTEEIRRVVEKHMEKIEKRKMREKRKEMRKLEKEREKRLKEAQRAREQAKKEYERQKREGGSQSYGSGASGMPGMGGMPGMMPGMEEFLNDPEIAAGLQNPKVMAALQKMMSDPSIMSNPTKSAEFLQDPEVAAFMQKFTAKMAGSMGGMPGGMGGMPGGGFGGMPGNMGGPGMGTPFSRPMGASNPSDDVD